MPVDGQHDNHLSGEQRNNDDDTAPPPSKRRRVDNTHTSPSIPSPPRPILVPDTQQPQPQVFQFPIQPLSRFHGTSASIKRPREVAHFSYDSDHNYKYDDSGISYYHPPALGTDLCEGFDTFRHYEDTSDPHLDSLLKTLIHKEKETGEQITGDFVTWRGMMTKIMTAPYDMFASFTMRATRINNTIYLEEDFASKSADRASEADPPRPSNPHTPSREMMTYWGYKFETISMLPHPVNHATSPSVLAARTTAQVSNHAQHCSIVKTAIGSHSLLLGGEVDGLSRPKPSSNSSSPDAPIPWVELKTSEILPRNPRHHDILKFERKLLKFWAQSFLLGVPEVVVGFRSKGGVLQAVERYETGRIPGMVRRGTACWDGNVCINFTATFLGWLRGVVGEGEGVWNLELRKRGGVVEVRKVGEGTGGIVSQEWLEWLRARERKGESEKAEAPKEEKQKVDEKTDEKRTAI
ncbi:RAI1-domain-containing protein [Sporormia fimetaria CBS 119925]|uniref:Decapping nuclease n=1 Tax=Sporormia fimetaria CBS 119925 TaxID=1340428 RepID=A0A6A6VLL9_9PLEO|nr:RAI1-domain-containing protein [Sporormia fimetaria CBS 119925]